MAAELRAGPVCRRRARAVPAALRSPHKRCSVAHGNCAAARSLAFRFGLPARCEVLVSAACPCPWDRAGPTPDFGVRPPRVIGGIPMNAQDDNTAPSRTGMRRLIPRFEFRRLHAMARVHIVVSTVLVGLGVITLVGGSFKAVAIAWAAFFLVLAALQFSVGYWFLAIVRSAPPRT